MITDPVSAIAVIVLAATSCQWLAARLRVPSVMPLLAAGVAMSTVLDPDEIFGDLLFPIVGLGVALLLFEGGTTLHWQNLTTGRDTVIRLVTAGAAITWAVGAAASWWLLDIDGIHALLLGAILIVSGPTVVMPLLRTVRPGEPTNSILRWEGIVIDPIGAGLAIIVLDAIIEDRSVGKVALRVLTTFGSGVLIGVAVGLIVVEALRRRLIEDRLQVSATLAAVVVAYGAANAVRPEAGLVAVTVLGIVLANQRRASAAHIAEFNEHLGATILGALFIVLGARVNIDAITDNLAASAAITALLVVGARPVAVLAATLRSDLGWPDRAFLMTLAPRGVVAAAVASLFAIELEHNGIDPGPLVPVVFTVVVATVILSSLTAGVAARKLRVARPAPKTVAIIGGGRFAVELAARLSDLDIPSLHVGLDDSDAAEASQRGQLVYQGRLDTEEFLEIVTSTGVGTAVALSGTDYLDAYLITRLANVVGSANVYGLINREVDEQPGTVTPVTAQPALPEDYPPERLSRLLEHGATVRIRRNPENQVPGWLPICRVDATHTLTFGPTKFPAGKGQAVLEIGPGIDDE
ncbi:MAG: NhaP-type Na+/H+ or K+/H+ antiporter [Candidatus Aldehydirespiratoraceae bacterium]|jgi:NhaP-type Na+/H+ or K+/H+ antiporter